MPAKFKPFKAPAKFAAPMKKKDASEENTSDVEGGKSSPSKNEHIDVFEVMYTKHVH